VNENDVYHPSWSDVSAEINEAVEVSKENDYGIRLKSK